MSTCCRVCLQYVEEVEILDLSLICDEEAALTYSECFTVCTKIVLNINDGLPYNLCKSCGVELQMAYDFHKKVDESKKVLSQMLRPPIKIEASTSAAAASALLAASSFTVTEAAAATTETEKQQQQKMFEGNELNLMDQYADEDNMAMADDDMPMESYRESEEEVRSSGSEKMCHTKKLKCMEEKLEFLNNCVSNLTAEVFALKQTSMQQGNDRHASNAAEHELLVKEPFRNREQFLEFDNGLNDNDKFQALVQELMGLPLKSSKSFMFLCWRHILVDELAQHFCWKGTADKTSVMSLFSTAAIRTAFQLQFVRENISVFEDRTKKFFLYAKDRHNKQLKYQKRATN